MLRAVATTSVSFSLIFNKLPVVEKENKTLNVGLSNFSSKWKVRESEKEKSYMQDTPYTQKILMQPATVEKKNINAS